MEPAVVSRGPLLRSIPKAVDIDDPRALEGEPIEVGNDRRRRDSYPQPGSSPLSTSARDTVVRLLIASSAIVIVMLPGPAGAQTVSVSPAVGYRFGGDLYEELTATQLDLDGAPSVGVVLDVFTGRDVAVTFLYSHQEAVVDVPRATGPPARTVIAVDHWHGGSTQDFDYGRVRPFVDGSLGLTRFYGGGDSETRFSLGGGGGVKLLATRNLGVRLDGRVYAVFVDGDDSTTICSPGVCIIGLHLRVLWQADFTAGVVVSF